MTGLRQSKMPIKLECYVFDVFKVKSGILKLAILFALPFNYSDQHFINFKKT